MIIIGLENACSPRQSIERNLCWSVAVLVPFCATKHSVFFWCFVVFFVRWQPVLIYGYLQYSV